MDWLSLLQNANIRLYIPGFPRISSQSRGLLRGYDGQPIADSVKKTAENVDVIDVQPLCNGDREACGRVNQLAAGNALNAGHSRSPLPILCRSIETAHVRSGKDRWHERRSCPWSAPKHTYRTSLFSSASFENMPVYNGSRYLRRSEITKEPTGIGISAAQIDPSVKVFAGRRLCPRAAWWWRSKEKDAARKFLTAPLLYISTMHRATRFVKLVFCKISDLM